MRSLSAEKAHVCDSSVPSHRADLLEIIAMRPLTSTKNQILAENVDPLIY